MPNWCNNKITISGSEEKIKEIGDKLISIKDIKGGIFETLIGKPTDITEEEYKNGGWFDSNINRYGCKWDVFYDAEEDFNLEIYGQTILMYFSTAWSPCTPFCKTLSELYSVDVKCNYFEQSSNFAGSYTISNGKENEDHYYYYEGVYILDYEEFSEDIDFRIEWEIESYPNKTVEEMLEDYKYLNEKDRLSFIEKYNFFKNKTKQNESVKDNY
jgi:hypothetical protein